MLLKMYSIKDTKGGIFHPPHFQRTHGEAERSFKHLVNDEKSFQNKYPEDYHLYYIGQYDDQTGKIQPLDAPEHVIDAAQLKN